MRKRQKAQEYDVNCIIFSPLPAPAGFADPGQRMCFDPGHLASFVLGAERCRATRID
jgi:hypothetical protein